MRKEESETPHITKGNVLDDLGFDQKEALLLKLKSELHIGILKLIKKHGYTPRDLEQILNVQQPRVSELLRGKLSLLGVEKLLEYADRLGGIREGNRRGQEGRSVVKFNLTAPVWNQTGLCCYSVKKL